MIQRSTLSSTPGSEHDGPTGIIDRLLIAEDNLVNQEIVIDMLEQLGCQADIANNGKEALRLLAHRQYGMVLMDCEMPVLDGYGATRQLRALEAEQCLPRTPVVALTAYAIEGAREKCIECGMDDFLTKPFSCAMLSDMIRKWVSRSGMQHGDRPELDPLPWSAPAATDSTLGEGLDGSGAVTSGDVFDPDVLERLRAGNKNRGSTLANRVMALYLEQTPQLLRAMLDAGMVHDIERVADIAHTLKSSSLTIGAMQLANTCLEIETAGQQGMMATGLLANIGAMYDDLRREIESRLLPD